MNSFRIEYARNRSVEGEVMKKISILLMCICICVLIGCDNALVSKEIKVSDDRQIQYQYYRDQLDEDMKLEYDIFYQSIKNMNDEVTLNLRDQEVLNDLYYQIMGDHPEIFWINMYEFREYSISEKKQFKVYPKYNFSKDEVRVFKDQLEIKSNEIFSKIPQLLSDYEKVKYVYDYVIDHTLYKEDSIENQNILSVLLYGESVCAGYAKTVQYLLHQLGIPTSYMSGSSLENNVAHAWNMVEIEDEYYYLDSTYGDAQTQNATVELRYAYMNMTSSQMLKLYRTNDSYFENLKVDENNYFMKEDKFFVGYDKEKIKDVMNSTMDLKQFSIQLSTDEVFNEVKKKLLDEYEVFELLKAIGVESDKISYYEIEELHVIEVHY